MRHLMLVLLFFAMIACSVDNTEENIEKQNTNMSVDDDSKLLMDDLTKMSLEEQRWKFLELKPSERKMIWMTKFDLLIESVENLEEEKFYIELRDSIRDIDFSKGITAEDFDVNWKPIISELKDVFNWTDDDVSMMFATLYPVVVKHEDKTENSSEIGHLELDLEDPSFETTCNCRWGGLGCAGNDCVDQKSCPETIDDEIGCGVIFLQSCSGKCA